MIIIEGTGSCAEVNLFDYTTVFTQQKTVKQQRGHFIETGESLTGYEIHAGQTCFETPIPFVRFEDNTLDGIWDLQKKMLVYLFARSI